MVITVTGGTGTIGGELVRLLSGAGAPTRAVFRDVNRIQSLPNVVWVRADLGDERTLEPAIAGTERLFLLTDNQLGFAKLQIQVLRAAESLGVKHVVKLSALGASDHSKSSIALQHYEVERALQQTSMTWTILRPHAFMQNWLGEVAQSARSRRIIESPIEDGRVPFIDTRDIAAVAAEALLHPEDHAGKKYFLTGGEAVGFRDLAAAISDATRKKVTYRPITMEQARAKLEAAGIPGDQIEAALALAAYQRAGGPTAVVSENVQRILGRPPRTILEFVRDHVRAFEP